MMKIIQDNWLKHFLNELEGTSSLKIVSPFINENMVNHLINNWNGNSIEIITRFNLNDFRSGVSSIKALEKLVDNNVCIKGIKGLHSKIYIFDSKSVIITSANFTNGGFFNNYELGIVSNDISKTTESIDYFNKLWNLDNQILSKGMIESWREIIDKNKITIEQNKLHDYGISIIEKVIGKRNYFIKFYGRNDSRAELDSAVVSQVEESHCHFAVTFSDNGKRPRRYEDGDIVYMARMLHGNDYAIFGRAIAQEHNDLRDVASQEDIDEIDWKQYYPIYIRVHSPEFLNTTLRDCPKMKTLIDELDYDCFRSTKQRHLKGEANINPRNVLMQKPDVILSDEGAFWLENEFEKVKKGVGLISKSFLDNLYQGVNP